MTFPYTNLCRESCILEMCPVPGAQHWPRRLECLEHGYPGEARSRLTNTSTDPEKPNNYVLETASPADIIEQEGLDQQFSRY